MFVLGESELLEEMRRLRDDYGVIANSLMWGITRTFLIFQMERDISMVIRE